MRPTKSFLKLFFIFLLLPIFLFANEVKQARMKINGQIPRLITRASCPDKDNGPKNPAQIFLPPEVLENYSEFRLVLQRVELGKKDSSCPKKFKTSLNEIEKDKVLSQNNILELDQTKLLLKDQCASKKGKSGQNLLCIYPGSSYGDENELVSYIKYSYKTTKPIITEIPTITSDDSRISFDISYTDASNVKRIETCIWLATRGRQHNNCPGKLVTSNPTENVKISGLKNNKKYFFKARLIDQSGKESDWSKVFSATPAPTAYPLEVIYNEAEGTITCQTSNSSSWLYLALALLMIILIKFMFKAFRIPLLCVFICASGMFFVAEHGHADVGDFHFGILGALYRPALDKTTNKNGEKIFPIYKCFFRKDTKAEQGPINPLLGLEFDYTILEGMGSLRLGLGMSYTYVSGHGLIESENNKPLCNKQNKNSSVSLHMYQIRPQLTYAFDDFKEYFPLFPYFRTAFVTYGYSFFKNGKNIGYRGTNPNGFEFGYQAGIGLMLMLDFLEPSAITAARSSELFKHVFLKAELSYLDTFGNGLRFGAFDVMGSSLPLMWTFGLSFQI